MRVARRVVPVRALIVLLAIFTAKVGFAMVFATIALAVGRSSAWRGVGLAR